MIRYGLKLTRIVCPSAVSPLNAFFASVSETTATDIPELHSPSLNGRPFIKEKENIFLQALKWVRQEIDNSLI